MNRRREFIPALNREWLTPIYDPLIRWTMRESVFKLALVRQARILPAVTLLMRHFEETRDHFAGRLPEIFRRAGLTPVEVTGRYSTFFGPLALYRARRPG